jgi:purine-binding chemotaxis protein CheW
MSTEMDALSSQHLTFQLEGELFAVEVARVREVLDLIPITKVPRAPDYMRGMINVRGNVVPVVDMHVKFGMTPTTTTRDTRIIVLEVEVGGEKIVVGAIADAVHEVAELQAGSIEAVPRIGIRWNTEFMKGIGKRGDRFVILLDVNRVFSSTEMDTVKDVFEDTSPAAAPL